MVFTGNIDLYKVYETLSFGLKTEYSSKKRVFISQIPYAMDTARSKGVSCGNIQ